MAQIWVTHAELARFSHCAVDEIEERLKRLGWPLRACSDGLLRVKLPDDMAFSFMRESVDGSRQGSAPASTQREAPIAPKRPSLRGEAA